MRKLLLSIKRQFTESSTPKPAYKHTRTHNLYAQNIVDSYDKYMSDFEEESTAKTRPQPSGGFAPFQILLRSSC